MIDCSPEGHQPDVPTRIFQGVQQPVCIVLAARKLGKDDKTPAHVRFRALPKGKREEKFKALAALSLDATDWTDCPTDWRAPFLPEVAGQVGGFRAAARSVRLQRLGRHAGPNVDHRPRQGDTGKTLGTASQKRRMSEEGRAVSSA